MLDVEVYKGARWRRSGRLDYRIHTKHTSQWRPLASSSCHHPSVHASWPSGQIARIRNLCSSNSERALAVRTFVHALAARFEHSHFERGSHTHSASNVGTRPGSRIKIPFNYVWESANLPQAVYACVKRWAPCLPRCAASICNVGVSWKLGGQHLIQRLARFNRELALNSSGDFYAGNVGW